MRHLLAVLATLCLASPTAAQSFTRDWRPEERTVIGDFSRINAIAASSDRVYIVAPSAVLIWNPQFRRWEGSFDPPDPSLLARVFTGLGDPLDNSLWLARPDGWVHYQADIQLWDQGVVPDGVVAIAFDQDNPGTGLYLRTRAGLAAAASRWNGAPAGSVAAAPGRSRSASRRRSAATPLSRPMRRQFSPTIACVMSATLRLRARSTIGAGISAPPASARCTCRRRSRPFPSGSTSDCHRRAVGAVFSWPGGVWAATDRTQLADASLTFVAGELDEFQSLPGSVGHREPRSIRCASWLVRGRPSGPRPTSGWRESTRPSAALSWWTSSRGLPDSRVYSIASRGGRITVGTARGVARIDESLQVERVAPSYSDAAYAVFPAGDSVWVGTPSGLLLALPGLADLVRPAGLASPSFQAPRRGPRYSGRYARGAHR